MLGQATAGACLCLLPYLAVFSLFKQIPLRSWTCWGLFSSREQMPGLSPVPGRTRVFVEKGHVAPDSPSFSTVHFVKYRVRVTSLLQPWCRLFFKFQTLVDVTFLKKQPYQKPRTVLWVKMETSMLIFCSSEATQHRREGMCFGMFSSLSLCK